MTKDRFIELARSIARDEKNVSDLEWAALSATLNGESPNEIAQELGVTEDAIRKRLGVVYDKFGIVGRGSGKLSQLQQILIYRYQEYLEQNAFASGYPSSTGEKQPTQPNFDWDDAPDVRVFYGRTKEMTDLKKWIVKDRCRVVAIYGMGGIGKTALAVKLAKEIQGEFEYIIWRSLRNPQPLEELLTSIDLLKTDPPEKSGNKIASLMEFFRNHRCLLILDDWEEIWESGTFAGNYKEIYQNYGELLRRVGESKHKSCLLLTCREKAGEIAIFEGKTLPVRSFKLEGLDETAAQKILQEKGLSEEDQWHQLIKICRGNPLGLKMLAASIQELSLDASVSEFLKNSTASLFLGNIDYLLHKQYKRLSNLEKEIMKWLVEQHKPATASQILDNINSEKPKEELRNALASLGRRSLIERVKEREQTSFELQPVVKEYVRSIGS